MGIVEDARRQLAWRPWDALLDRLPSLSGARVLDLGCGVGDVAFALARRGAIVTGVDANEEFLAAARERGVANASFVAADLCSLGDGDLGSPFDGIWSSFAAAYLPDPSAVLDDWRSLLRPGGWIALTEIDDLFAHEPLEERAKDALRAYADEAIRAGRYDFRRGRRLAELLATAGFTVQETRDVEDLELSFDGPALPQVLDAWRARFDRMPLLQAACGGEFAAVRDAFLRCLAREDHRSVAKVIHCVATARPRPRDGSDS